MLLTPAQAVESWISVRRDHYWRSLGLPWDEAVQRARHDWATLHRNEDDGGGMTRIDWSDQDVDDHVLGSGAFGSNHWLVDASTEGHGRSFRYALVLRMPDVEDDDPRPLTIYRFARDDVRRAAQEIADGHHDVADNYRRYIRTNDVDAGTVDVILQILAYGRIVYS